MVQQSCRASALYHGGLAWLVPNLTVGTLDTEAPRAGMEDHWAPPWNEQFPVRTWFHRPKPERKWTYINAQPSIFRGNLVCTVSFREGNSKLFLNGSWSKEERNQDMPNEKWMQVKACRSMFIGIRSRRSRNSGMLLASPSSCVSFGQLVLHIAILCTMKRAKNLRLSGLSLHS